ERRALSACPGNREHGKESADCRRGHPQLKICYPFPGGPEYKRAVRISERTGRRRRDHIYNQLPGAGYYLLRTCGTESFRTSGTACLCIAVGNNEGKIRLHISRYTSYRKLKRRGHCG